VSAIRFDAKRLLHAVYQQYPPSPLHEGSRGVTEAVLQAQRDRILSSIRTTLRGHVLFACALLDLGDLQRRAYLTTRNSHSTFRNDYSYALELHPSLPCAPSRVSYREPNLSRLTLRLDVNREGFRPFLHHHRWGAMVPIPHEYAFSDLRNEFHPPGPYGARALGRRALLGRLVLDFPRWDAAGYETLCESPTGYYVHLTLHLSDSPLFCDRDLLDLPSNLESRVRGLPPVKP